MVFFNSKILFFAFVILSLMGTFIYSNNFILHEKICTFINMNIICYDLEIVEFTKNLDMMKCYCVIQNFHKIILVLFTPYIIFSYVSSYICM